MNKRKILLIDYDPTSISRTATPLTQAGYDVEVAKDGVSGLEAFDRLNPALVLVEAMLPRKHGVDVCQEIKSKPNGKSTPVLITTAVCRGQKYREDALETYGCDEYIEKPIAPAELLSMIARLIEESKREREEIHQELSEAVDTIVESEASTAIELMSDDEIDAQIDALVLGDDATPEKEDVPAAPVASIPTLAAAQSATDPVEEPDKAFDPETEMERRLQAMVEVDPANASPPTEVESPVVDAPNADPLVAELEPQEEPRLDEPVDIPVAPVKPRGVKAALFLVAILAVFGALAFVAFRQGWIGGTASPELASTVGTDVAVEAPPPMSLFEVEENINEGPPAPMDPIEVAETVVPEPVATEAEPVELAPPAPVVRPRPTFKRRSAASRRAARVRQAEADQALQAAAGSLQLKLLSEQSDDAPLTESESIATIDLGGEDLIGFPVPPKASRGELFDIEDVDSPPVPVKFEQPPYDELARRLRQEGLILVEVLIDESGAVAEARLTQEIPRSRLNATSLRAAQRWTYEPAIKDGVPVKVWKTERISFELE